MRVSDVQIKLAEGDESKLLAYGTVFLDSCFVVRDLKIIKGSSGLFVAMPSRRITHKCPKCRCKNHIRASYCNQCGVKLKPIAPELDGRGRPKLHTDITHPLNRQCRIDLEKAVIEAYEQELIRSKKSGYKAPSDVPSDA